MKVYTRHPGLCDAIRRAGHEPVLLDSEAEPEPGGCRNTEHCQARRKWGDGECGCGHPFPPEIDATKYPSRTPKRTPKRTHALTCDLDEDCSCPDEEDE